MKSDKFVKRQEWQMKRKEKQKKNEGGKHVRRGTCEGKRKNKGKRRMKSDECDNRKGW